MQHLQVIAGYMRKAIAEYGMIKDGDHIAVGVSGGKDSVALLTGLCLLKKYMGISYRVSAVTLDPAFDGKPTDYSAIEALCASLDVSYILRRTEIGNIVFNIRHESNPCSLCARMRRGALHDVCNDIGANKLALGHNRNDAVETFVMNLFSEGRIGCFSPVTWLSRKEITVIRPLIYAPEQEILAAVRRAELPIVKSVCPVDKTTNRQKMKQWLREREKEDPGFSQRLFGAMKRAHISQW